MKRFRLLAILMRDKPKKITLYYADRFTVLNLDGFNVDGLRVPRYRHIEFVGDSSQEVRRRWAAGISAPWHEIRYHEPQQSHFLKRIWHMIMGG